MTYSAMQLKQIAALCDKLSEVELDECVYNDNSEDATLINTKLLVTARSTGKELGNIKFGTESSYVFTPFSGEGQKPTK